VTEMLQLLWAVYGKQMMFQSEVFERYHRFKDGCELEHNLCNR